MAHHSGARHQLQMQVKLKLKLEAARPRPRPRPLPSAPKKEIAERTRAPPGSNI